MPWTVGLFVKIKRTYVEGGSEGGFYNGERGKKEYDKRTKNRMKPTGRKKAYIEISLSIVDLGTVFRGKGQDM